MYANKPKFHQLDTRRIHDQRDQITHIYFDTYIKNSTQETIKGKKNLFYLHTKVMVNMYGCFGLIIKTYYFFSLIKRNLHLLVLQFFFMCKLLIRIDERNLESEIKTTNPKSPSVSHY